MVLMRDGEIKMKQTTEGRSTARVSLEWMDLEYDIAYMWTRDDGSNRLDFMSHLDSRRATSMDDHNGEWIRDVWATATEVLIDPSKVNGPGRDKWDAILARWSKETVDRNAPRTRGP